MQQRQTWAPPLEIKLMNLMTRILIGVFVGTLCLAGFAWFINQPKFDIQKVEIENANELKHVDLQKIEKLSAEKINGNFFTANLNELQDLYKSIPWVKKVTIKRVWPYQVQVVVYEYDPVAYWGSAKTVTKLLDRSGDIFEVNLNSLAVKDLPLLKGPEAIGIAKIMWDFFQVITPDVQSLGTQIDELEISEHGIWRMKLKNGTKVVIGSDSLENLGMRVHNFSKTIKKALEPFESRTLLKADLRYSSGYAMEISDVKTVGRVGG